MTDREGRGPTIAVVIDDDALGATILDSLRAHFPTGALSRTGYLEDVLESAHPIDCVVVRTNGPESSVDVVERLRRRSRS